MMAVVPPVETADDVLRVAETVLQTIWQSSITPVAAPGATTMTAALVVAVLVVAAGPVWHWARHAVTIAHEGGHATAALLTGRRLRGIRLHSDTSGVTTSSGRTTGFGFVLTAFSGYPAPALVGLGCAWLVGRGYATAALWVLVGLLLLTLNRVRNLFGVWSVIVTAAVVAGVSWWAPATLRSAIAHAVAWFLFAGAVRPILELQRLRSRRRAPHSDADQLQAATGLPGLFWIVVWLVLSVGAAWLGTAWMLEPAGGLATLLSIAGA